MNELNNAGNKMNNTSTSTESNVGSDEIRAKHINNALHNILSDDKFKASPKMSAFLSYVVQETISGKSDRIKAYTVAVDALGKPTCFDPQNDPSVRVLANRLRSSLENYYAMNPEQALFIELYRGSYVPHFVDPSGEVDHSVEYAQSELNKKLRIPNALQNTPVTIESPERQQSSLQSCH